MINCRCGLTREEALKELKRGKKITHPHFPDGEFLFELEGRILTSQYYDIGGPEDEFWKGHSIGSWAENWEIVEESSFPQKTFVFFKKDKPLKKGNKGKVIIDFLNKNSSYSLKEVWKNFEKNYPNLCSRAYFYTTYHKFFEACKAQTN